jgi:catechol 2,3-dioxygenase-like lactoylglutathione lyase family enzyme
VRFRAIVDQVPRIDGILETSLYVADLARAGAFWEEIVGLAPLAADARFRAYDAGRQGVLLLFLQGATNETVHLPGGTIPPHDGAGRLHLAFAIGAEELVQWEAHLAAHGVAIEGRTKWPRGGTSLYFRDPDGHLVELATPGLWKTY